MKEARAGLNDIIRNFEKSWRNCLFMPNYNNLREPFPT